MTLTLLEKLDRTRHRLTLEQSVCDQIQRIVSTRTYLGDAPDWLSYVTAFGVPEIVDQFAVNSEEHEQYRATIRRQILALEPRVQDVEVQAIQVQGDRAFCQLAIKLKDIAIQERFYF